MRTYPLRIPDGLMEEVERLAAESGMPVDTFLLSAIARYAGAERTRLFFSQMAKRADPEAVQRLLDQVPDVPPMEGDELPNEWLESLGLGPRSRRAG